MMKLIKYLRLCYKLRGVNNKLVFWHTEIVWLFNNRHIFKRKEFDFFFTAAMQTREKRLDERQELIEQLRELAG